jgi:hypothetical protein
LVNLLRVDPVDRFLLRDPTLERASGVPFPGTVVLAGTQ